jgi:hypothetical protein
MTKPAPSQQLLYIMLRAQLLAKTESSDGGYVMIFVSILTIMMFSLLAAYLMITNISKSATNAYVEGNSTFYAAESGLNKRANAMRQKFLNYGVPDGVSPGPVGQPTSVANIADCVNSAGAHGSGDYACQQQDLNYSHSSGTNVSKGADGKSLTATSYNNNVKYTAYTFAADRTVYTDPVRKIPQVTTIPPGQVYAGLNAMEYRYTVYSMATSKQADDLDAKSKTVLEMTFKNRAIALFQFAAFYDGDLEMNSTSQMNLNGRVHTNGNFYSQPTPVGGTGANTRIFGALTVAGSIYNRVDSSTVKRNGDTAVLMSWDPSNPYNLNAPGNVYEHFPPFKATDTDPLDATEIAVFKGKVLDGAAGVSKLKLPPAGFLRKRDKDGNIGDYYGKADLRLEMFPKRAAGTVPFNFTAIQDGGSGGSCAGFDIPSTRQGANLKCTKLNEGQLRSLQQPVMVKVTTNVERTQFCPTVTINYNPAIVANKQTLRALQVAIAAQNSGTDGQSPVSLSQLDLPLNSPKNASISNIATSLLATIDTTQSPKAIAAAIGACFRPAPIQTLTGSEPTANTNYNWRSSFYDRRENRWIGMLQMNIASLTIWNRDGVYVDRDNNLTTNDTPTSTSTAVTSAFNNTSYDTKDLLFIRAAADTTTATVPAASFRNLGLGAADITEGGLTLYATVSDDLDDNGTSDITTDINNNRIYPGRPVGSLAPNSPYGFAVSDGADLPGAFTVATDRPIYVQGNYNNFGGDTLRQSASLVGDVITVLSNNCTDATTQLINCGITAGQRNVTAATTTNAAFLSFTDQSSGNIGGAWSGVVDYSGGLNNYMRMLENWAGRNYNYLGSFVSLGIPQEFSGDYLAGSLGGTSYYTVPTRNFGYDTNFNSFSLLPPLTPRVIYLQQETFKRSYK